MSINLNIILNGVIMLQYVRCHIVGVVYHPVGVHVVEVVLEVGQEQGLEDQRQALLLLTAYFSFKGQSENGCPFLF